MVGLGSALSLRAVLWLGRLLELEVGVHRILGRQTVLSRSVALAEPAPVVILAQGLAKEENHNEQASDCREEDNHVGYSLLGNRRPTSSFYSAIRRRTISACAISQHENGLHCACALHTHTFRTGPGTAAPCC